MRKQLLLVCPLMLLGTALWGASTCTDSSMSAYDASGFMCTLGGITFSNFGFAFSGTVTPPLTDTAVTVTPTTDSSGDVTLQFDADWSAGAGLQESVSLSYLATASSAIMTGESIAMQGFNQNGSGAVNIGESICVGGKYLSTGQCTGSGVDSIGVYDDGTGDMKSFDSVAFNPDQSQIDVVKNITVQGGTAGSNSNATVSEVFNTTNTSGGGGGTGGGPVPEPNTLIMLGSGLMVAALAWRRRCQG